MNQFSSVIFLPYVHHLFSSNADAFVSVLPWNPLPFGHPKLNDKPLNRSGPCFPNLTVTSHSGHSHRPRFHFPNLISFFNFQNFKYPSASTNPNPNLRKYPSSSSGSSNDAGGTNMDFGEELASLMGSEDRSPQGQNHVQNQNQYAHNHHHQQDDGQQHRGYGPSAHGIFDASAMLPHGGAHPSSVSSTASEYHGGGAYNPALNSSIRYEPVPEAGSPALSSSTSGGNANPPPSAFHHFSAVTRHTPSPIHSSSMHSPSRSHSQIQGHSIARSRSRSRPPTSTVGASSSSLGAGGVGPARTTRARRNNSVSGTSPPPAFGHHHHHGRPHPHAIVIPGSRSAAAAAAASGGAAGPGGGWFVSGQSS